jgi:hypothetical protein
MVSFGSYFSLVLTRCQHLDATFFVHFSNDASLSFHSSNIHLRADAILAVNSEASQMHTISGVGECLSAYQLLLFSVEFGIVVIEDMLHF